ncbi:MAG: ABC transporter ATPase [Bacteroidia bacterium]
MLIPFKDLSPSSRIWIYQCNRFLEYDEIEQIKTLAYDFVNNWTAHKQTLHAGFEIFHNLFLVLAVDENVNDASGCSIDKAFGFIKQMENLFKIELLNRMNVAIKNNNELQIMHLHNIAKELKSTDLNQINVFNNLIETKADLESKWLQPVDESWLKNFL